MLCVSDIFMMPLWQGCKAQDHLVKLQQSADVSLEPKLAEKYQVYNDMLSHRDVICQPFRPLPTSQRTMWVWATDASYYSISLIWRDCNYKTHLNYKMHSNSLTHPLIHSPMLLPRGRGDGTGKNVGPPAATIEGDVRSLQQCCPQLLEVFGEDILGSEEPWPSFALLSKLKIAWAGWFEWDRSRWSDHPRWHWKYCVVKKPTHCDVTLSWHQTLLRGGNDIPLHVSPS